MWFSFLLSSESISLSLFAWEGGVRNSLFLARQGAESNALFLSRQDQPIQAGLSSYYLILEKSSLLSLILKELLFLFRKKEKTERTFTSR